MLLDGCFIDLLGMLWFGDIGVDLLLCDLMNVEIFGVGLLESEVGLMLYWFIWGVDGWVIVVCFVFNVDWV